MTSYNRAKAKFFSTNEAVNFISFKCYSYIYDEKSWYMQVGREQKIVYCSYLPNEMHMRKKRKNIKMLRPLLQTDSKIS